MTVEPALQAIFYVGAFLLGLLIGLFSDALNFLVLLLDIPAPPVWLRPYYEKKLPILKRSLGIPASRNKKRWSARLLKALCEVFLPALAAVLLAVLAFTYCNGVLRPSGILLVCVGLFLWKKLPSKFTAAFFNAVAFLLRLIFCYVRALLWLPIRLLGRVLFLFLRPLASFIAAIHLRYRMTHTKRICACELRLAKQGFDLKQTFK